MHDLTAEVFASKPWGSLPELVSPPNMLAPVEVKMLSWLAGNVRLDGRSLVDAGSFLGGSTCALASGADRNTSTSKKDGIIHAYDLFRVQPLPFARKIMGDRPLGSSTLDVFEENIASYRHLITIHEGDFMQAAPPEEPVVILFVDVAKTWELNDRVVRDFFPLLVAGESIVVQQDHNDHSCPWVNVTMEYYADHFEYVADAASSRLFRYVRHIPSDELVDIGLLPLDEKIGLAERAAARSRDRVSAFLSSVSVAWLLREKSQQAANEYLDRLRDEQPWKSETRYVDMVRTAMRY